MSPASLPRALAFALVAAALSPPASAQTQADAGARFAAESPRVLVVPKQQTTLVAPAAAMVRDIVGGLGASFGEGDTLVRFDCQLPAARREIAAAEVSAAEQNLQAKRRLRDLKAAGEVEVGLAEAALEKARAELGLAEVFVSQCRVRAPFPGRVVKQHVQRFQGVQAGAPLLEIVATGPLELRLNVPSRWLAWLARGARFEARIDETGRTYEARVSAINARVDAVSQSVEIEAEVRGSHPDLLVGMSGIARFEPPQ